MVTKLVAVGGKKRVKIFIAACETGRGFEHNLFAR